MNCLPENQCQLKHCETSSTTTQTINTLCEPKGEYIGKYGLLHLIAAVLKEPRKKSDDKEWLAELKELLLDSVRELDKGERGKLHGQDSKRSLRDM